MITEYIIVVEEEQIALKMKLGAVYYNLIVLDATGKNEARIIYFLYNNMPHIIIMDMINLDTIANRFRFKMNYKLLISNLIDYKQTHDNMKKFKPGGHMHTAYKEIKVNILHKVIKVINKINDILKARDVVTKNNINYLISFKKDKNDININIPQKKYGALCYHSQHVS